MTRYIDADALDSVVLRMNEEGAQITRLDYKIIDCVIFEFPTIDAVPVIRCKDCKWYEPRILKCNNSKSTKWHPDDYCSDAERREE